jgi:hypothetical protein
MIEYDGKNWYWCGQHRFNNRGVVSNGIYVTHKSEHHELWKERRSKGKRAFISPKSASADAKPKPASIFLNDFSSLKLALSKSLQAALVTTAGITEDQFNKIWTDACSASGN